MDRKGPYRRSNVFGIAERGVFLHITGIIIIAFQILNSENHLYTYPYSVIIGDRRKHPESLMGVRMHGLMRSDHHSLIIDM